MDPTKFDLRWVAMPPMSGATRRPLAGPSDAPWILLDLWCLVTTDATAATRFAQLVMPMAASGEDIPLATTGQANINANSTAAIHFGRQSRGPDDTAYGPVNFGSPNAPAVVDCYLIPMPPDGIVVTPTHTPTLVIVAGAAGDVVSSIYYFAAIPKGA